MSVREVTRTSGGLFSDRFRSFAFCFLQEMVRKNAMLNVVNPAIDPLGPQAFELEKRIQDVLREMESRGQTTIPRLRRGKQ